MIYQIKSTATSFCLLLVLYFIMGSWTSAVEVTLWHHWGDRSSRGEWIQTMLDEFMVENPDIEADQVFSAASGAESKLFNLLISGSSPEIVMVRNSYARSIIVKNGFMPLDELMARDGIVEDMFIKGDLANFQFEGSTYALPVMSGAANNNLMFYNKRLLAEAGLPDTAPVTWSEFRDWSLKTTRRDPDGRVTQGGSTIPSASIASFWNDAFLWDDSWKVATVNTPEVHDSVNFLKELMEAQYSSPEEYSSFTARDIDHVFYIERVAMSQRNTAAFNSMLNFENLDWGVGLAPLNDRLDPKPTPGSVETGWAYAIPADLPPEKIEATWKLLQWLSVREESAGWFARIQGRPSPVVEFNRNPEYRELNPYWDVVISAALATTPSPPVSLSSMNRHLQSIVNGSVHAQQGLTDAERALQNALDEMWSE